MQKQMMQKLSTATQSLRNSFVGNGTQGTQSYN
jgi:hypothetical protein